MCNKPFYLTTAIAYASQKPHFGNTYEVILSDAVARWRRQQGYDVFFTIFAPKKIFIKFI